MDISYLLLFLSLGVVLVGLSQSLFQLSALFAIHLVVFGVLLFSSFFLLILLSDERHGGWFISLFLSLAFLLENVLLYAIVSDERFFALTLISAAALLVLSLEGIMGSSRPVRQKRAYLYPSLEQHTTLSVPLDDGTPDIVVEQVKPSFAFSHTRVADGTEPFSERHPPSSGALYVASSGGACYHQPGCWFAKRILPDRRIIFSSREEAERQGFEPCACVS